MVSPLLLFFSLLAVGSVAPAKVVRADGGNGVYSGVTVRVDEAAVPRQHCNRAVNNLKVRRGLHTPAADWIRFDGS